MSTLSRYYSSSNFLPPLIDPQCTSLSTHRLGPIYQKVHRTTDALEFFTKNEWIYKTDNFQKLNNELPESDRRRFVIDVRKIDWPKYMENYVLGVRHFLLNEDPATIASAKMRLDMLYYATQATKVAVTGVSAFCFYKLIKLRRK